MYVLLDLIFHLCYISVVRKTLSIRNQDLIWEQVQHSNTPISLISFYLADIVWQERIVLQFVWSKETGRTTGKFISKPPFKKNVIL